MSRSNLPQNYDRLSRIYPILSAGERRYIDLGVSLLHPKPGQRILDIGCGTGHAVRCLAKSGAYTIGLDLSIGMLSAARKIISKKVQIPSQPPSFAVIPLCQGDGLHLPFKAGTFNSIFVSFTLELFSPENISKLLQECQRILRRDGQIAVIALAKEDGLISKVYESIHTHWPQIVDCKPIHVHQDLIHAGYEITEARRLKMWGLPVDVILANKNLV